MCPGVLSYLCLFVGFEVGFEVPGYKVAAQNPCWECQPVPSLRSLLADLLPVTEELTWTNIYVILDHI